MLQIYDYMIFFWVQSIGSLQKKYSIGSFELLSKTAPIQAGSLLVLGPIIDYYLSDNLILDYKFTSGALVSIDKILSCIKIFCSIHLTRVYNLCSHLYSSHVL